MLTPASPSRTGLADEIGLRAGDYTAVITRRGAALRVLRHRGRDLIVPFEAGMSNPDFRGIIAAPWPNRMRDGTYTFDGVRYQVPINESERNCALHGLAFSVRWTVESLDDSAVDLSIDLGEVPGYPFSLRITAQYSLSEDGLDTRVSAANIGDRTAPYGVCPHPYLVAGSGELDTWSLKLSAETFLEVTPDRLLPTGTRPVADHEFDFRRAHPIGSTVIDHAFTDLVPDQDGRTRVTIADPGGTSVAMEWDNMLPWVQIHTADRLPPNPSRLGLAVEPMTCPPDAFTSGRDLIRLRPGAEHRAAWRIVGTGEAS